MPDLTAERCSCRPNVPWMDLVWRCPDCQAERDADDILAVAEERDRLREALEDAEKRVEWARDESEGGKWSDAEVICESLRDDIRAALGGTDGR